MLGTIEDKQIQDLCIPTKQSLRLSEQRRAEKPKASRRKGESRAPSPFPLGGCSALPRTGGIPQPLEARPYGQAMPAHLRVRHLDLAARRQQALRFSVRKSRGKRPRHLEASPKREPPTLYHTPV